MTPLAYRRNWHVIISEHFFNWNRVPIGLLFPPSYNIIDCVIWKVTIFATQCIWAFWAYGALLFCEVWFFIKNEKSFKFKKSYIMGSYSSKEKFLYIELLNNNLLLISLRSLLRNRNPFKRKYTQKTMTVTTPIKKLLSFGPFNKFIFSLYKFEKINIRNFLLCLFSNIYRLIYKLYNVHKTFIRWCLT